ncbi:unnamed protein product [Miscanthus lutarioriparius]|uniref:Uncharacterized protein n=1 Tax=Miscanthus lutarioriparius TaxID=422564 RepID=A0A811RRK8_9POAL|nr:unnamed protein product [Miscanthus lutarioriparius]
MTAAAPVAPGSGRLSRPRPRPPWARDSYYSGQPLIVDDMFDKVELKLRLYGSKSVVKYPRCSLIRQSTYADAEEDQAMFMALSSIWMLLLLFGTSAFLVPSLYTLSIAFGDVFGARHLLYGEKSLDAITRANDLVLVGLGHLVGYPIASASVGALRSLLTNNLVALKGSCPNCGEQVFAFVKTDKSIRAPHRAECHVCECPLEYRTKIEVHGTPVFSCYFAFAISKCGKRNEVKL